MAVHEVDTEGPAQKAGLRRGDVILTIGSQPLETAAEARNAALDHEPGEAVSVRVQRGSEELDIQVELGTRPGMGPLMPMAPGQGPFWRRPGVLQPAAPFADEY